MASPESLEAASMTGRLLITAATLAYGLGPFITDFNRTHLFHPAWPGHARLHLVWATVGQFIASAIALWLIWAEGPRLLWRCHLATLLGVGFVGAFFVALVTARFYRGTLHDPGGIKPFHGVDGNVVACVLLLALLVGGWIAL